MGVVRAQVHLGQIAICVEYPVDTSGICKLHIDRAQEPRAGEIASLLIVLQSALRGVTASWKHLRSNTATLITVTGRGYRMLKSPMIC